MAKGSKKQQYPFLAVFLSGFEECTTSDIQKTRKNSHVVYPSGKPMTQHLLRCLSAVQDFGRRVKGSA
jgi:hypothetical protein